MNIEGGRENILQRMSDLFIEAYLARAWATKFASLLIQPKSQETHPLLSSKTLLNNVDIDHSILDKLDFKASKTCFSISFQASTMILWNSLTCTNCKAQSITVAFVCIGSQRTYCLAQADMTSPFSSWTTTTKAVNLSMIAVSTFSFTSRYFFWYYMLTQINIDYFIWCPFFIFWNYFGWTQHDNSYIMSNS